MPKAKVRRMKMELSAKPDGFKVEWNEPEEKAKETFAHFHQCLTAMLKAHGLMADDDGRANARQNDELSSGRPA